ncbi:hypothetical protein LINGRAHAP2_LOCUS19673 [Linum grandiflorum]
MTGVGRILLVTSRSTVCSQRTKRV